MHNAIIIRQPQASDGHQLFNLVTQCPPLDCNSMYCNLLQCSHFAGTSAAAEQRGQLVGFVSGYLVPTKPDTLFIWQVAVSDAVRGKGIATKLLIDILNRPACQQVNWLETTITPSNQASWLLFQSIANRLQTKLERSTLFDKDIHFNGVHDSELLARIGPF